MKRILPPLLLAALAALQPVTADEPESAAPPPHRIEAAITAFIAEHQRDDGNPYNALVPPLTRLLSFDDSDTTVTLVFSEFLGHRPWNPKDAQELEQLLSARIAETLGESRPIDIRIRYALSGPRSAAPIPFADHITYPEGIRARAAQRSVGSGDPMAHPVVRRADHPAPPITHGLSGRNIVVGPSHGWTWHKEQRWQFQRARLWTVIEDLYPLSYMNPFLIPMLENAGATVFSVRERDWQLAEVIVDDGANRPGSDTIQTGTWRTTEGGWNGGRPAVLDELTEPFLLGSSLEATVDPEQPATFTHVPTIPRRGRYAVYTSWKSGRTHSPSVPITVNHLGGSTTFRVNQTVAGQTWIFLGFFEFDQGSNPATGSVTTTTNGAARSEIAQADFERAQRRAEANGPAPVLAPTIVSVDAVRFGGGMGNAAPADQVSGKPRYAEAARYFLQYAGAPRDLVYLLSDPTEHFGIDYWRDIIARAEWANFLTGAPSGPNLQRNHPGLGVPVEAYISFHTDAGIDKEGTFGTLSLYRLWDQVESDRFPDGRPRMLNRDLTALMAEELMRSARELYSTTWKRRALQQRNLGEIRRPNVPSTLLELLSHQNFNDMKYGLDPRWKFDMSRAMYKSILRFVAWQHGVDPVIQPLAPLNLRVVQDGAGSATLTWAPQPDPLEPSAMPDGYVVYTSRDGRSFDNGTHTTEPTLTVTSLEASRPHYFRVTAVNAGGESFPTPVVGTRWAEGKRPVLIVDGFDRLSGPAIVERGNVRGFDRHLDPGVGYEYNYGLVGDQYDYDETSEWKNDLESTGWGASNSDWESRLEPGNMFNHTVTHGSLLHELDYAFDSCVHGGFMEVPLANYRVVNWVAGRQRRIDPPPGITGPGKPDRMRRAFDLMSPAAMTRLATAMETASVRLLISGSHIEEGIDLLGNDGVGAAPRFKMAAGLSFEPAQTLPLVAASHTARLMSGGTPLGDLPPFRIGRDLDATINLEPTVYPVPSGEVYPARPGAWVGWAAGDGTTPLPASSTTRVAVVYGFPLESVLPLSARKRLLAAALEHLSK